MGKRQFITLRTPQSNEETDMEIPSDRPVAEILPEILKILNWPLTDSNGKPLYYSLIDDSGKIIPADKSFSETHIDNFEIVKIILDERQKQKILNDHNSVPTDRIPGKELESEEDKLMPQPIPFMFPIDGPCLISSNGTIFMLGDLPALIGRKSQNCRPQIDLSDLDKDLKSSRSHAEIIKLDDAFALHVLNPKNGMIINGTEYQSDTIIPLNDGDVLQFGFKGVQLTWREPKGGKE